MTIEINYSETSGPNVDSFIKSEKLNCFIGICPYSFMANRTFLEGYLYDILPYCSQANIVIGDYLERYNLMVFEQISEKEALTKVEKRGHKIKKNLESILSKIELDGAFKVYSCRSDIESSDGQQIARSIHKYIEKEPEFRADIDKQIYLMLKNSQRVPDQLYSSTISAEAMNQLREYMIEELVLYLVQYNLGYTTEIYPGRDVEILNKMASNKYRNFPFDYSKRTHISVAVLMDSGKSYAQLDDDNHNEGE